MKYCQIITVFFLQNIVFKYNFARLGLFCIPSPEPVFAVTGFFGHRNDMPESSVTQNDYWPDRDQPSAGQIQVRSDQVIRSVPDHWPSRSLQTLLTILAHFCPSDLAVVPFSAPFRLHSAAFRHYRFPHYKSWAQLSVHLWIFYKIILIIFGKSYLSDIMETFTIYPLNYDPILGKTMHKTMLKWDLDVTVPNNKSIINQSVFFSTFPTCSGCARLRARPPACPPHLPTHAELVAFASLLRAAQFGVSENEFKI